MARRAAIASASGETPRISCQRNAASSTMMSRPSGVNSSSATVRTPAHRGELCSITAVIAPRAIFQPALRPAARRGRLLLPSWRSRRSSLNGLAACHP